MFALLFVLANIVVLIACFSDLKINNLMQICSQNFKLLFLQQIEARCLLIMYSVCNSQKKRKQTKL